MNTIRMVLLVIIAFLAISSGLTKIILMQQDVEFFGKFGFSNRLLIAFGVIQLLSGLLLLFPKTRIAGASIVAITFLISAFLLGVTGDVLMTVITIIFVLLLLLVIKQTINNIGEDSTKVDL